MHNWTGLFRRLCVCNQLSMIYTITVMVMLTHNGLSSGQVSGLWGCVCGGVQEGKRACQKLNQRVFVTACQQRAPGSAKVQAQVAPVGPPASTRCPPLLSSCFIQTAGIPLTIAWFNNHLTVVMCETLLKLRLLFWHNFGDQCTNRASVRWGTVFDKNTDY